MTTRDDEFAAFVVAQRGQLVRTATLLTAGDQHLGEDLVQVALTRVYVAWHRIRSDEGPGGYAHRTLVNAFIDHTRRPRWRREKGTAEVPEMADHDGLGYEDREAVRSALRELPTRMRAAVIARHWLDMDVAQAARALGCSTGNVKSQTARGLERLRAHLAEGESRETPVTPTTRSAR